MVLGALLRFATLDAQSFSNDELFSAWLMQKSFGGMIDTVPESEATPPLFYVLEWLVTRPLGTGEVGMRLLPALAGTLTIAAVYAAGALAASRRAGLAAAAFAAVNPFLVWYSQEARAYALMILLVALSLVWLAAHWREGRGLTAWAVASAAALATHYFALVVVAPAALWLLLSAGAELRRRALAIALPAVTGLALVPLALHQRDAVGDPGGIGERDLLERVAAIPKSFLVGFSLPAEALVVVVAALCAVGALAAAALRTRGEEREGALMAGALAVAGVALTVVIAPFGLDYASSKNVIAALVPAALVLGCGFAATAWGRAALGVLCVASVATVIGVALEPAHQRPDWRGAAEALGPAPMPGRVLVFNPPFTNTGPFSVYFGSAGLLGPGDALAPELAVVALTQTTGFGPSRPEPPSQPAAAPPPGFRLAQDELTDSYRVVRYTAPRLRRVARRRLAVVAFRDVPAVFVYQAGRR